MSNRNDGSQARDSEYRELLADRIAEAIVEQRFGSGVYRGSTQVAAQSQRNQRLQRRDGPRAWHWTSLKFLSALFAPDCGEQDQHQKDHQRKKRERLCIIRMAACIMEMVSQPGFNNSRVGGK